MTNEQFNKLIEALELQTTLLCNIIIGTVPLNLNADNDAYMNGVAELVKQTNVALQKFNDCKLSEKDEKQIATFRKELVKINNILGETPYHVIANYYDEAEQHLQSLEISMFEVTEIVFPTVASSKYIALAIKTIRKCAMLIADPRFDDIEQLEDALEEIMEEYENTRGF